MSCNKNISRGCCFGTTDQGEPFAFNIDGAHKMEVCDWMLTIPRACTVPSRICEVRFKNTRKSFFENVNDLELKKGDIVAVEGNPGVDIGLVSMTSELVGKQIKRVGFRTEDTQFKKILRRATSADIDKWQQAIALEHSTMIKSRQISADLGLDMKIGDVEYQGDRMKAIFYYIADGRVDFRELIKVLFEQFRIRVEMKQIGARQEAGRIGGISGCGRELCCSSWINHFSTIGIGAARAQDISPNPQKLAGQCGKLKCCLNYEVDTYLDAKRSMPRVNEPLQAMDGAYYLVKTDPLTGTLYFSPDQNSFAVVVALSADRVREIQTLNRQGTKADRIENRVEQSVAVPEPQMMNNIVGQESLTRFDKKGGGNGGRNGRNGGGGNGGNRNGGEGGNNSRRRNSSRGQNFKKS